MHRRSYYPHNQQIVSTVTATSSSGVVTSRPVTPMTDGPRIAEECKVEDTHSVPMNNMAAEKENYA